MQAVALYGLYGFLRGLGRSRKCSVRSEVDPYNRACKEVVPQFLKNLDEKDLMGYLGIVLSLGT